MSATLLLAGDVMIGRSFNELFRNKEHNTEHSIWGNTMIIKRDFFGINLETTITDSKNIFPHKAFNFKLSPAYKDMLKQAGVSYANLANNHSLDYSADGLHDTITNLDSLGIEHSGAGNNLTAARKPVIITVNGLKIGVISAGDHPKNFAATDKTAGVNIIDIENEQDRQMCCDMVSNLKTHVNIVIFSIHHGKNWVSQIPASTIEFFHRLATCGVNIIHGHSAHHVLPYEVYNDCHIFYSMGDFIDDYTLSANYRNDLGFMAQITVTNNMISDVKIHPTRIKQMQVNLLALGDPDYDFVKRNLVFNQKGGTSYVNKYYKYKLKYMMHKKLKNTSTDTPI